jgi:hypothetical protein
MSPEQVAELTYDEEGRRRLNLWLEFDLSLVDLRQTNNFTVVVTKVSLYDGKVTHRLLMQRQENRPLTEVVATSKLSEGITNPMTPIHTLSVFGVQLQEVMVEPELVTARCSEVQRIDDHRAFECEQEWPGGLFTIKIRRHYLGGTLVGLDLLAFSPVNARTTDLVIQQLGKDVNLKWNPSRIDAVCWNYKEVAVRFDPERLSTFYPEKPFIRVRPLDFEPGRTAVSCADGEP